jgi:hypothetical protein
MIVFFVLFSAIWLPICKEIGGRGRWSSPAMVAAAVGLGVLSTAVYLRFRAARTLVTILWPVVLLAPGVFLFFSPISKLLAPSPPLLPVKVGNPAPLVMIVFDEFCGAWLMDERRGIDPIRYPNFAALAREATWFRNASSMSTATHTAIPALLTGKRPRPPSVEPDLAEYPKNLFTLLGESYAVTAAEPCTFLCPERLAPRRRASLSAGQRLRALLVDAAVWEAFILLPADWPVSLPDITGRWDNLLGSDEIAEAHNDPMMGRREKLDDFLAAIRPAPKHWQSQCHPPQLYFAHLLLPHTPWVYLPSGKEYYPFPLPAENLKNQNVSLTVVGLRRGQEQWVDDEAAVALAWQRYMLQTGFADRVLGRLVARLKEAGLYDRSLIVITADHGISFRPGQPWRNPTPANFPDVMAIPLFVKTPGQRAGAIDDRNVQTFDVLPTIAEVLKVELPWTPDGLSALDLGRPERPIKEVCVADEERPLLECDGKFPEKYASLARMLARFGSGSKPQGLFRGGPHGELVGRPVEEIGLTDSPDYRAELFDPGQFAAVDLTAGRLPCYVGGRVIRRRHAQLPRNLAVAVNGVVWATTRTFCIPGLEYNWAALLPEQSLRAGANDVRVFVLPEAMPGRKPAGQ